MRDFAAIDFETGLSLVAQPNHQLHTVSEYCGYHLANYHHALADAEACAWIAREIL